MLSDFKNAHHTEEHNNNRKYVDLVKEKYAEPQKEEILGSYVNEKETKNGSKSATGKEIGTARYS